MSLDLRFPNITATTPEGQLNQMRSFLHQTIQQLNWAFKTIESGASVSSATTAKSVSGGGSGEEKTAANTFNDIKALIIKSADIVNAYYEQISGRLEGEYVAKSAFGEYFQKTSQDIQATSEDIKTIFTNVQKISSELDDVVNSTIATSAYLKSGLLYYADDGAPVYGLEIGQTNTIDGENTFDKFARFTSDRLSFYDQNDTEVAFISDYKLFITNAEVSGSLILGQYKIDTSNGLAFKWVGGESLWQMKARSR